MSQIIGKLGRDIIRVEMRSVVNAVLTPKAQPHNRCFMNRSPEDLQ